ncbi:phosphonopyruvate decarboxylase [Roseomonas terrae]|jgi:sulfopyruvate decarboxylase alpha subunit|uniref:Phosphonopyruvate decarboxylase n=1 Tax=Neoroseomonas terrae TaxID=424799 RepID=A0ABS5EBG4_9PROT|nr:thiamine pyrophosphate-binding protein [Neoroseomonas terrae]MBR0648346.1 phosphonopyruvate decarboxylase [Neoroseomonas terrae]
MNTQTTTSAASRPWQEELYDVLKEFDVSHVAYVPDGGHRVLIDRALADPEVNAIPLTTEEEGVAMMAGVHLGGGRGVLLMQSSGSGNCINMLSLISGGRFPFLTLVTMRGEFGEGNPWQFPMGQATQAVLEAMGLHCIRADTAADIIPAARAAANQAYFAGGAVAVLMGQRLIGAKRFW